MCAGAIVLARIPHLVYGAPDEKAGAAGTLLNICQDPRLNHCVEVTSGVLADESIALLQDFFQRGAEVPARPRRRLCARLDRRALAYTSHSPGARPRLGGTRRPASRGEVSELV